MIKKDAMPADTSKDFPFVEDYKQKWMELWGKA